MNPIDWITFSIFNFLSPIILSVGGQVLMIAFFLILIAWIILKEIMKEKLGESL